jgi:HPt (histidine-containing phosphotransfer) domain-containing protein
VREPAFDPAVLDSLRQLNQDGQPDIVREVMMLFAADVTPRVEAIARAADAGGGDPLRRAAHALKGAAATAGAQQLHRICRELEEMGKSGRNDGLEAALSLLRAEHERVLDEIKQLL